MMNDPNVRMLIDVMDLQSPSEYNFVITDYGIVDGMIVIKKIKVLDIENNFIRFADLTKVLPSLSKYRVIFESNDRVEDSDKTN
jgi:hypothetical protein